MALCGICVNAESFSRNPHETGVAYFFMALLHGERSECFVERHQYLTEKFGDFISVEQLMCADDEPALRIRRRFRS